MENRETDEKIKSLQGKTREFENFNVRFDIFLSSGNGVVAYWKIAAHMANHMFSKYKYLIVNLVFPPKFLDWQFLSDCAFS